MATTTRFDHSNCGHPKSGNEGKKARAKCRKAHAEAAAKEAEAKKPVRKARATRKPAASKAKAAATPKVEETTDDLVADLA